MRGHRVVALGALVAAVSATVVAQAPVFKAGVDAVLVDVEVLEGGHAVTGLSTTDFQLLDNGVPQTLDAGSLKNTPIDVTLVVDTSGSVEGRRFDHLKAGVHDTTQWLRPDDRWRVISVEHVLHEVVPLQAASKATAIDTLQPDGGTALYDGLIAALMEPHTPGRRQMLVAYTDGDDASSITTASALLDVARLSDSVVHVVVPVENARARLEATTNPSTRTQSTDSLINRATAFSTTGPAQSGTLFPNENTFTELTARTGGRVFVVDYNDSVSEAFKRVIDAYRTSYLLQYTRNGVSPDGWHDLTVKVTKPGHFEVRARKGYWGG
jgi:VWFA-related protein